MESTIDGLWKAVLGSNFFGVDEWERLYGVSFTEKQLCEVIEFPWSESILNSACPLCGKTVKDCHFAFLGLDRINGTRLTILKWQEIYPAMGQPKFRFYAPNVWYTEQKFANDTTMKLRWYLLHRNIVPYSEDKTFDEQKIMLTAEYELPLAIVETTKDFLVFCRTGEFVNPFRSARCECVTLDDSRVSVGDFGANGLNVYGDRDNIRCYGIGVAASRKFTLKS